MSRPYNVQISDNSRRKKLLPSQKHKIEARLIAEGKWQEDPNITIAEMVQDPDINKEYDGIEYKNKTLRGWINNLAPNRKPGRRKKL